jgi:hypothetical protein
MLSRYEPSLGETVVIEELRFNEPFDRVRYRLQQAFPPTEARCVEARDSLFLPDILGGVTLSANVPAVTEYDPSYSCSIIVVYPRSVFQRISDWFKRNS